MSRESGAGSGLSPERRALLDAWLGADRAGGDAAERIPRRGGSGPWELSPAQERLWFLHQLDPLTPVYNIPVARRLTGPLDVAALERCIAAVFARHEILRTTFTQAGGGPRQRVADPAPFALAVTDLAAPPAATAAEREARMLELAAAEASRPFDLERGPVARVGLVRLDELDHVLLVTFHHIVADGWSVGVFFHELATHYGAYRDGREPALAELPLQYADFALWQRRGPGAERLAAEVGYWKDQLGGAPELLALPLDRPRPPEASDRGARCRHALSPGLRAALVELSRARGATLFMTLLAAFQLLLARLAGQPDVVVGIPLAGRLRSELEGLIGMFLNSLPVRVRIERDLTFHDLLDRVRDAVIGLQEHQEVPFERLLEELRPARDLSRTPIFQVFFNFLSYPVPPAAFAGLAVAGVTSFDIGAKFDLTLYADDDRDGIDLALVYRSDLFDPGRMQEMLRQLDHLLGQIVAAPEQRVETYSLRTAAAAALLPDPRMPLDASYRGGVHEQFAAAARSDPGRTAVVDRDGSWSYGRLEASANALARRLGRDGIEKGDVVAIFAHRSAALVAAVLAVLKAGAAFLLLDPAHPALRLVHCLRAARARGWLAIAAAEEPPEEVEDWLARERIVARLELPAGADALAALVAGEAGHAPDVAVGADDLACVGFTSGSTGGPKGVLGRHGPLSHFRPWLARTFDLGPDDRFSMLSSLAHDPLQRDIFTPLQLGASLCIPAPEAMATPGWLADWMTREGITVTHLTPAMSRVLCDGAAAGAGPGRPSKLRWAFFLGDALRRNEVRGLRRLFPGVRSVSFYGATETQRAVSYHEVADDDCDGDGRDLDRDSPILPIGRGIDDVQLLVLGPGGRPAGIGEVGELSLRSPHLARGYLDDADLTRDRFRPNPNTHDPGDRIYRTGDLGRYRPDGDAEFLGRADHQVKVRGFRVEPAEIEHTLDAHPAIREAVVLARPDPAGDNQLVAYLAAPEPIPTLALRRFLRERLPDYMIPARFVHLAALPRTGTGKVDRNALPDPAADLDRAERIEPRTATEKAIAAVWREVLGVATVGIRDNFFDLGGHSLQIVGVLRRLEEQLGATIQLRELVRGTLEQIAAAFDAARPDRTR